MPFPYINETQDLTDAVRADAGGSFIRLPDGVCHYELSSGDKSSVVLVHGFSVPYFIWDPTFDFLSRSGFRVLRYDLFGRGYSDRPRARYDIQFFVRQLHDLLEALDMREPISVAGLSMGGPISAAFIEKYPERVAKHILVDPTGAQAIQFSPILRLAKIPVLSDLAFGVAKDEVLLNSVASDFYDPALIAHFIEKYRPQMKIKGFKRAILSTMRNNMLGGFPEIYRSLARLQKPTLIFWGRNDNTVPFAQSEIMRGLLPLAEFHAIEGVGHIPHYERPDMVNPLLLKFLSQ